MHAKRVYSNGWTRNLLVRFYTLHLAPKGKLGGKRWRSSPLVSRQASNTSYSQRALPQMIPTIQLLHQTHSPSASLQVLQIHPLFFGNGYARRRSIILKIANSHPTSFRWALCERRLTPILRMRSNRRGEHGSEREEISFSTELNFKAHFHHISCLGGLYYLDSGYRILWMGH